MLGESFKYHGHRNSYTELNSPYFWTITIREWTNLLLDDEYIWKIFNLSGFGRWRHRPWKKALEIVYSS
jgi:hypothetical protein